MRRKNKAIELLDSVGIPDAQERLMPTMTFGRAAPAVGIAMALANDPVLIVPTSRPPH